MGESVTEYGTEALDLLKGHQAGGLVPVHAPRIVVDDVLQPRDPTANLEHLVHLLLVLRHDQTRFGRLQHPGQLCRDRVLVEAQRQCPDHLRTQLGDHPFGPVVADDRDPVALLHAQLEEPQGKGTDAVEEPRPGDLLPDAEFLFAKGDLFRVFRRAEREEAGEGVGHACGHELAANSCHTRTRFGLAGPAGRQRVGVPDRPSRSRPHRISPDASRAESPRGTEDTRRKPHPQVPLPRSLALW